MRDDEEPFHLKCSLRQIIELQRQALFEELGRLPERQLTQTPLDELTSYFAEKYSINIPVLDEENISPNRREVEIDVSNDMNRIRAFHGGPQFVKGTEITISVPFFGDAEIFRIHPSNHIMNYPRGHISNASIKFSKRGQNLDASHVRREFDLWLTQIKGHLAGMRTELGTFNDAIKVEIKQALQARVLKLRKDDDLLKGLGFSQGTI